MIFINLILSLILFLGVVLYRVVCRKKKINLFFLLLVISVLPIVSIFRYGDYESGDFNIHLYRSISFYESLKEGNVMPSWAGQLNATYGYPLFIFNYSLPYYLVSFFHFLGFSFILSLKFILAFSLIISGIGMYLFTKSIFKYNLAAFFAAVSYIFVPYHLIDLHFKVAAGEIFMFSILPFLFLYIQKFLIDKKLIFLILAGFIYSLLVSSHAALTLFATPLIGAYLFFFLPERTMLKRLIFTLLPFGIGLLCSVHLWLGANLLLQYTIVSLHSPRTAYFPTFLDLLASPWRMGFLFQGPKGELSHLIGYTQLFVLVSLMVSLIKGKIPKQLKKHILFWLTAFFIFVFFITPFSKPLWEHFTSLTSIGSHRLLLFVAFITSVLAGYFVLMNKNNRLLIYSLLIITIAYTLLNWGHRRMIPEIDDQYLKANLWKSTSQGEAHYYAMPKWADTNNIWISKLPKSNLEVIKGSAQIQSTGRTSTKHTYQVDAKTPVLLQENTVYFPGWTAKANGEKVPITPSKSGMIHLSLPQGIKKLEVFYEDIPIYKRLKMISVVTSLLTAGYLILVTALYKKSILKNKKTR